MSAKMTDADPPVVLTRRLSGTCAEVFEAWTDPALVMLWLAPGPNVVARAEIDARPGGAFLLETRDPDGARHRITGQYREVEPVTRIVQSWIYDGPLDLLRGVETELEIEIAPAGEGSTEFTLTHRRIARADVRAAYAADWPTCFDKLETALG